MPELLNKFLSSDQFFENHCLRLSQPAVLNDPEEARPKLRMNAYSLEDQAFASHKAAIHGVGEGDAERMFLTPFPASRFDEKSFPSLWPKLIPELRPIPFQTLAELDKAIALKAIELILKQVNQSTGVLCLSSTENEVMWTHYANRHKGLMVSFDSQHPFFRNRLRAVVYSDSLKVSVKEGVLRLAGKKIPVDDILQEKPLPIPEDLFLRKALPWSYEQEVRIIQPLSQADRIIPVDGAYPLHLLEMPSAAIYAITFGYEADRHGIDAVMSQIKSTSKLKHVKIFKRERSTTGPVVKLL